MHEGYHRLGKSRREKRDEEIGRLRRNGLKRRFLAERFGLTLRGIDQILRKVEVAGR